MNHRNNRNKKQDYESAYSFSSNLINTIHNAIKTDKVVTIEYHSREKGLTKREIEPMDIVTRDGKTNLVGWCRLRNDWRTFRMDRINFIAIQINNGFEPREGYNRADFADANSESYSMPQKQQATTANGRPNKELSFENSFGKTMTDNKLNLSNSENIVTYSEDEEDLAM